MPTRPPLAAGGAFGVVNIRRSTASRRSAADGVSSFAKHLRSLSIMDAKAISKAESRLRSAEGAVERMKSALDLRHFEDHWYEFLVASKNVWTVLKVGARVKAQSSQWFGGKEAERRRDPLLQYLYQARNDDEHGLRSSVEVVPGFLGVGKNAPGYSQAIRLDGTIGPGGTLRVTSMDGKPILTEVAPARAYLVPVHDRDEKTVYQPPCEHLSRPLTDTSPVAVAEVGLTYLRNLVAGARQRRV